MQRSALRKSNDNIKFFVTAIMGIVFGFFLGISMPSSNITKIRLPSSFGHSFDIPIADIEKFLDDINSPQAVMRQSSGTASLEYLGSIRLPKIYVPTNPRGAESLPPGIVVSESDFHLRRLWGEPNEDLQKKPKYLVTFTVGYDQRYNIDASVKKFSDDFAILLFHYDNRINEWDEFEWSRKAIHVSARKQTKWWYAKRFLHPDIVSAYEYIFIWDEDLGVEHFNGDKFMELIKRHGLEISQPALENSDSTWEMTKRRGDRSVHK